MLVYYLFLLVGHVLYLLLQVLLYGRRITYLICFIKWYFGLYLVCRVKTSDTIWSQAFVGISEACAEAQVQQSLTDLFFSHNLGAVLTLYISATSIGSFLGPLIAQYESYYQSFRWVGWWVPS